MQRNWLCKRLQFGVTLLSFACHTVACAQTESATLATQLERLVRAYPAALDRIDGNALVWKDGTRMPIDDGLGPKTAAGRLENPDIKDMLHDAYPAGTAGSPGTPGVPRTDPGRARPDAFFAKLYGDCRKGEVQALLVDVVWLPQKWGRTLKVASRNGAAEKLAAVSRELDALPGAFDRYLFPPAGTYNCRPIAGTARISAHSHGIAVDLATSHADYWRWSKPGKDGNAAFRNRIPMEIVAIFERHGFIWGGRWAHFDTMHFEYRPELLPPATRP